MSGIQIEQEIQSRRYDASDMNSSKKGKQDEV